jgi:trans-aconitate 2-methyltransferase
VAHTWDPHSYLAFGDQRSRPYFDLLARVGAGDPEYAPAEVVDLGCGPGNLTATLPKRWPTAQVHGVDSSSAMADQARTLAGERLSFEVADLREYRPAGPVDVVVSNATLQWVPGHLDLLGELARWLRPGGWLAFQVPGNFGSPSHTLLRRFADDPRFAGHTADVSWPDSHDPDVYLARLFALGLLADAWETTYQHVLTGPDPVLRWISSTGARPVLEALPRELRTEFEEESGAALKEAYPAQEFGTVLPFRRVFAVAQTPV